MKMIEARKVVPLIRLILFGNPKVDEICKTAQELVDLHTIEATSVVNCGDCEYYNNDECDCPYILMSDSAHLYPSPDDYCNYGKRREGE